MRVNECGRDLETVDACSATEFCRDASCVARLQGDVCASALPLDLASGGVLVTVGTAIVVGLVLFVPRIIALFW